MKWLRYLTESSDAHEFRRYMRRTVGDKTEGDRLADAYLRRIGRMTPRARSLLRRLREDDDAG